MPLSTPIRRTLSNVGIDAAVTPAGTGEEGDTKDPADLSRFLEHVCSAMSHNTILIDATDSDEVAAAHPSWIKAGETFLPYSTAPKNIIMMTF